MAFQRITAAGRRWTRLDSRRCSVPAAASPLRWAAAAKDDWTLQLRQRHYRVGEGEGPEVGRTGHPRRLGHPRRPDRVPRSRVGSSPRYRPGLYGIEPPGVQATAAADPGPADAQVGDPQRDPPAVGRPCLDDPAVDD